MEPSWLSPGDTKWGEVLELAPHDTYHLAEYVALCAAEEDAQPVAFHARSDDAFLFIPLLIRRFGEHFDAISPYGYAGPLCGGDIRGLVENFLAACEQRGIVSIFMRLHPLLNAGFDALEPATIGSTVYIDLAAPATVRHDHRYDIGRLERRGFQVTFDDWDRYANFQRMYDATMARVEAHPQYRFGERYFEGLRAVGAAHLATVMAADGQTASAALLLETRGIVQYHLAATSSDFLHDAPSKLLVDRATQWARERGNRYFHLGGGVGASADDGLFAFKAGFSDRVAPYRVVRAIVLPEIYERLSAGVPATDFFPRYRFRAVRS